MCGIAGYLGYSPARSILLTMLSRLEYRGYDSCGIAVQGSPLRVFKDTLRVQELANSVPDDISGTIGIGHTRWATHGEITQPNAHPHVDCSGNIAVVHNGIIVNYQELRSELISEGHVFSSETDTEVIAHLIEKHYRGILEEAVTHATAELNGSWAILVVAAHEHKLVAAREKAPVVIGLGENEYVIASDAPTLAGHVTSVIYLEDGDVAAICDSGLGITNKGQGVLRTPQAISQKTTTSGKNGFEHHTLKEIYEQPDVLRRILPLSLTDKSVLGWPPSLFLEASGSIDIIACGSSYHAGLVGKHVIENLLDIPVSVIVASEYALRRAPRPSLAVVITQSGETADVLAAARYTRGLGVPTLAITNTPHSSILTMVDQILPIGAEQEVGAAATKTYTAQLAAIFRLVLSSPRLKPLARDMFANGLVQLPGMVSRVCIMSSVIETCARFVANYERVFIIGRGVNLPTAHEGALKLKELAYIHAEGYAAGELKHGPFALLDKNTPVIAILADDETRRATLSSIHEVITRRAPLVVFSEDSYDVATKLCDFVIPLPRASYPFSAVINAVALQLLAYHAAKYRQCPIDFPRNIAKSMTIE